MSNHQSLAYLMAKADELRRAKWAALLKEGVTRVNKARGERTRITPTRFYRLMYGAP